MDLFAARGFDTVTVDEIAAAAGMSARTFFRYFASKEDVVLQYQRRLDERLIETVRNRPADEGPVTALRNSYLATSTVPPGDREAVAVRSRVTHDARTLRGRSHAEQTAKDGRLVAAVAERMGVDPMTDERPHVISVAMAAVASAAWEAWLNDGHEDDPADTIAAALALVEQGLLELDDVARAGR
jgi:AcrR family transcriptional regulator